MALFANPDAVLPWDSRVAPIGISDGKHCVRNTVGYHPFPSARGLALGLWIGARRPCNHQQLVQCPHRYRCGLNESPSREITSRARGSGCTALIAALLEPFKEFNVSPNLLMVGASYRDTLRVMPSPLWMNSTLAELADMLSLGTRVYSPRPGQCADLGDQLQWRVFAWAHDSRTTACLMSSLLHSFHASRLVHRGVSAWLWLCSPDALACPCSRIEQRIALTPMALPHRSAAWPLAAVVITGFNPDAQIPISYQASSATAVMPRGFFP